MPGSVPGTPGAGNVFRYDCDTDSLLLVSHSTTSGAKAAGLSGHPQISNDGTVISFLSKAGDLVPNYTGMGWQVYTYDVVAAKMTLVSHTPPGPSAAGNASASSPRLSGDGRYVVFFSAATDLIPGFVDGNGPNDPDVYLYDRVTDTTTLVSHKAGSPTTSSNGIAYAFSDLSDDGRLVLFTGYGSDLLPGQVNGHNADDGNTFAFDRVTSTTALVNNRQGSATITGNWACSSAVQSADGGTIAFSTGATDILPGLADTNGAHDVFVRDTATGATVLASRRQGGPSLSAGGLSGVGLGFGASVSQSADGRYVAFVSNAANFVSGQVDRPYTQDIFLADRKTGVTQLVSHAAGSPAAAANAASAQPVISADGRYVAYTSHATDLVAGFVDNNGVPDPGDFYSGADTYLFDRVTGLNVLVSHKAGSATAGGNNSSGTFGDDQWYKLTLSDDGRYVCFTSVATDLVAGFVDNNGTSGLTASDVYLFDRTTGLNRLVSHAVGSATASGNGSSRAATVSGDGRYVAFFTNASNIAGQGGLVYFDRVTGFVTAISVNGLYSQISRDGKFVLYESPSPSEVPGQVDTNNNFDLFLYNRVTGTRQLVTHAAGSLTTAANAYTLMPLEGTPLSDDGRFVAYATLATDLVAGFVDGNDFREDVYLFDRVTGVTTLLSRRAGTVATSGQYGAARASVAGDGRYTAFESGSMDLVAGTTFPWGLWGPRDLYVYDRLRGTTVLASHDPSDPLLAGAGSNGFAIVNQDGSAVTYISSADNLVAGDFNAYDDVVSYVTLPPRVQSVLIADGSPQRSVVRSLTVTFDQPVFFAGEPAAAFELARNGVVVSGQWAVVSQNNPSTVTITFAGSVQQFGSLMDGRYTLRVFADQVSNIGPLDGNNDGVGGDDFTFNFHRLFGDADGNGFVDAWDFRAFRAAFGSPSAIFDFDNDGDVDAADFVAFRGRFRVAI